MKTEWWNHMISWCWWTKKQVAETIKLIPFQSAITLEDRNVVTPLPPVGWSRTSWINSFLWNYLGFNVQGFDRLCKVLGFWIRLSSTRGHLAATTHTVGLKRHPNQTWADGTPDSISWILAQEAGGLSILVWHLEQCGLATWMTRSSLGVPWRSGCAGSRSQRAKLVLWQAGSGSKKNVRK